MMASDLGNFGLSIGDLGKKLRREDAGAGTPVEIPVDRIAPDPANPRKAFDAAKLKELATSIEARGIIQPIVLRPENDDGIYVIRFGERRWRAAKIAGLETVPAVFRTQGDDDSVLDQVLENEQRQNLQTSELVDAVRAELAKGRKKSEIARHLGKPAAIITLYAALADAPEPIAAIVDKASARAAYNLLGAWKLDAVATEEYIAVDDGLTEAATARFFDGLKSPPPAPTPVVVEAPVVESEQASPPRRERQAKTNETETRPARSERRQSIQVHFEDQVGTLVALVPGAGEGVVLRLADGRELALSDLLRG